MSRREREQVIYNAGDDCVICLERGADVALLPCSHCVCSKCLPKVATLKDLLKGDMSGKKCPHCRGALAGFRKLSAQEITALKNTPSSPTRGSSSANMMNNNNNNNNSQDNSNLRNSSNASPPRLPLSQQSTSSQPYSSQQQQQQQQSSSSQQQQQQQASSTPALPETTPLWCDKHPAEKCITSISHSAKNPNREFYRCTSKIPVSQGKWCCFKGWTSQRDGSGRGIPRCGFCDTACVLKTKSASDPTNPLRKYYQCPSGQSGHLMLFAEAPKK